MRKILNFSVVFLALSLAGCGATTIGNLPPPPPPPQTSNCNSLLLGQGASLGGFVPFPSDSLWNQDISSAPLDANSSAIISFIGSGTSMHADFGAGQCLGSTIGIPYLVVGGQQPPVAINFTAYGSESDPGPMPVPVAAPIEGYPNPGAIIVTVTFSFSTIRIVSSTSFLAPTFPVIPGTQAPGPSGIFFRTNSALTLGPAQTPQGFPSSPVSYATMKWPPERFPTRCASLCRTARQRLFLPPRTGPPIPAIRTPHPWACACA